MEYLLKRTECLFYYFYFRIVDVFQDAKHFLNVHATLMIFTALENDLSLLF